ncbi:MAG: hypothetical protein AMS22_04680, partial [Thiotrichales bacterium SG8_50]
MKFNHLCPTVTLSLALAAVCSANVVFAEPKYKADVPSSILTPNEVKTRLGTLRFKDGAPDAETVKLAYDNLDFMRGVQAFLDGIPAASVYAMCKGFEGAGVDSQAYGIWEALMDARSLLLTPNSSTIYVTHCFDLKDGPVVLEASPGLLGPLDDAYFRHIIDVGLTGPDKGKGGKYLLVPPGYEGKLPEEGYFIVHSPTYTIWQLSRAFVKDG